MQALLVSVEEVFALADIKQYGPRRKLETAMTVAVMLSNHGIKVTEGSVRTAIDQLAYFKLLEFREGKYEIAPSGVKALKDANQKLQILMLTLAQQIGY